MTFFFIWLAGFVITAAVIVHNLKTSDFKEACGWPAVIGAACAFGSLSWIAVAIILMQVCLQKFGGE